MKKSFTDYSVEMNGYQLLVSWLANKVNQPRKYDWYVNIPGEFQAAEYLFQNHWDDMNGKTQDKVVAILLRSGKYEKTQAA